jgi:hypothetical protein
LRYARNVIQYNTVQQRLFGGTVFLLLLKCRAFAKTGSGQTQTNPKPNSKKHMVSFQTLTTQGSRPVITPSTGAVAAPVSRGAKAMSIMSSHPKAMLRLHGILRVRKYKTPFLEQLCIRIIIETINLPRQARDTHCRQ